MKIEGVIQVIEQNWKWIQGCSVAEINALEETIGQSLPTDYKLLLSRIGKEVDGFMTGSLFYYDSLLAMQEHGRALVKKNVHFPKALDENCFVFWFHQGYSILFFKLNEGANPPIYFYTETEDGESLVEWQDFKKVSDTLSDCLWEEVKAHLSTEKRIK
ncbi:SMI1/KNR4 family protein [Rhodocytophaga aerolata]|uniref:SMI1/KNR4 family protein n=1 Tax=Rhodocytophaga aerolata TaxID=455078 RepID=A0ABT8RJ95_9BACT|nr:SMI1/KNR4 family protein [Rhodocytophaga aerolata]MDO1451856.1 SMI1/KNR4 family protein [Rhodocytophaga aerolata]